MRDERLHCSISGGYRCGTMRLTSAPLAKHKRERIPDLGRLGRGRGGLGYSRDIYEQVCQNSDQDGSTGTNSHDQARSFA